MNDKTRVALAALGFTPAPESDPPPAVPGFDGGARRDQPAPAETHEATLLRIIRAEADTPSDWLWPHG